MRRLFLVGTLSALVVAGFPSAGAQTATVTSVVGAADGLSATLDVDGDGNPDLTFGPAPSVTLPPEGGSVSDEVLSVNESVPPIALVADVLSAAAQGALGPDGFATAESTVEDIFLGQTPTGVSILTADVVSATCSADLSGVTGSTAIVDGIVLGQALDVEPAPNTELVVDVAGVGTVGVTLNRQVENPDGSLSVTALVLEIAVAVATTGVSVNGILEIGPATCGVVEGLTEPAEVVAPPPPVQAQVRFTG